MSNDLIVMGEIKNLLAKNEVKSRFKNILGEQKSNIFMASIVNAVSSNTALQKCNPSSIMSAAFIAASFDLPIDQNLGFSAIVPYKDKAQFQIMYKGFIQLAIRTGQYKAINASEVYSDEIKTYNPITKEVVFVDDFKQTSHRSNDDKDMIIGFYAYFELLNGFRQPFFMTTEEVTNHAKNYSKAYQHDLREKKQTSTWTTDFTQMGIKTVIKLLLSKWGILSTEIQKAISEDQKIYDNTGQVYYEDNPANIPEDKENELVMFNKNKLTEAQENIKNASEFVEMKKIAKSLKLPKHIVDAVEMQAWEKIPQVVCESLLSQANKEIDEKA